MHHAPAFARTIEDEDTLVRSGAIRLAPELEALVHYLLNYSDVIPADGPKESFTFHSESGDPDLVKARHFAEALRSRFYNAAGSFRLYVTQINNRVDVYYRLGPMEMAGDGTLDNPMYGTQVRRDIAVNNH